MWLIGVKVEQETSAPPPKKNPGSAPVKHSCYQEYFVVHGWLVYWVFRSKMGRFSEIRFRKHRFQKRACFTLLEA